MAWQRLDDDKKMVELIRYSISQKQNVGFRIQGEKTVFYSQIMEIDRYRTSSEREERLQLIIKRLVPDKGNALIPAYSDSRIEFLVKEYWTRVGPSQGFEIL
jgi:hypothetical protein